MIYRTVLRSTFAFIVMLFLSATAHAQLFRAYLAPSGNDANPCTLPQPCRLLPAALTAVADGGEIWMLDSGNYNTGTVNITKSVTILAVPGALGSVVAAGGNAIDISMPGIKVALRNLVIVPLPGGGGLYGIVLRAGAGLTVENCLIANLPGMGILVSGATSVRITDTTIRDNGLYGVSLQNGARATITRSTISGNSSYGVFVNAYTPGTTTTADIADSTMDGNLNGVFAWSTNSTALIKVSVHDSRVVRNANYGLYAQSSGAAVTLSASNNIISNNAYGISPAGAGSKVWASGNTISGNLVGIDNVGGLFESAGNNAVRNNGYDTYPVITIVVVATK